MAALAFDMNQYVAAAGANPGFHQQLVVKHTFLELVARDPPSMLPRACTDSMVYTALPEAFNVGSGNEIPAWLVPNGSKRLCPVPDEPKSPGTPYREAVSELQPRPVGGPVVDYQVFNVGSGNEFQAWLLPHSSKRLCPVPDEPKSPGTPYREAVPVLQPRPVGGPVVDCQVVPALTKAPQPQEDRRTTVMMRNLPLNYSREMLLEMLDGEGFRGQYDFVYMPVDFKTKSGLGYAFVNLVEPSVVPRFWAAFDGFSRWVIPTSKVCALGWSKPYQGLRANLQRYRNSSVMHYSIADECKPVLVVDGVRAPFPRPTRVLQVPSRD